MLWIIAILVGSMLISGCSVIGLTVGANKHKKERFHSEEGFLSLQRGAKVVAYLENGTSVKGRYSGVKLEPVESYKKRYTDWHNLMLAPALPAFGDTFGVSLRYGDPFMVTFTGFDQREGNVLIHLADFKGNDHTYAFDGIAHLKRMRDGDCVKERLMDAVQRNRSMPFRTGYAVTTRRKGRIEHTYFSGNEILLVEVRTGNYAVPGLLIGLGMDALAVSIMHAALNDLGDAIESGLQDVDFNWYGEEE